jgi:hypothetical protein
MVAEVVRLVSFDLVFEKTLCSDETTEGLKGQRRIGWLCSSSGWFNAQSWPTGR